MMRTIRRTRLSLKLARERRRRQTLVWLMPGTPDPCWMIHVPEYLRPCVNGIIQVPKGIRYIETMVSRAPSGRVIVTPPPALVAAWLKETA